MMCCLFYSLYLTVFTCLCMKLFTGYRLIHHDYVINCLLHQLLVVICRLPYTVVFSSF